MRPKNNNKHQFSSLKYHSNTEKPSTPLLPNHLTNLPPCHIADKDHFHV